MKDITMIKKDMKEIQKSFNPEKSTYKVFDELIKHKYSSEEMINVLSKIRGIHKYPEYLKAQFLDVINNLNLLKEQEIRKREAEKREEERQKQQANTRELKDIIDSLEKATGEDKKNSQTINPKNSVKDKAVPISDTSKEVKPSKTEDFKPKKSVEFLEEIEGKALVKSKAAIKGAKNLGEDINDEDNGRLVFIILILLVIISIVAMGLFFLIY